MINRKSNDGKKSKEEASEEMKLKFFFQYFFLHFKKTIWIDFEIRKMEEISWKLVPEFRLQKEFYFCMIKKLKMTNIIRKFLAE